MRDTQAIVDALRRAIASVHTAPTVEKIGRVRDVGDGVASVTGLKEVVASELVTVFDADGTHERAQGVVMNLEEEQVGVVLLGAGHAVQEGDLVRGTGAVLSIPAGPAFLGRVVDPLGRPLDGGPPPDVAVRMPVERIAPGVIARASVQTPLLTGITAIDAMIPIGRGQRELIIGDRQTGKTTILVDTILNQKTSGVRCIYVAIGQKQSTIAKLVEELRTRGALENTIVVSASAADPATLQYVAPYAGCALGEYFLDRGQDALVVYDDLSKHAIAYREMSLLLRRPSGREAYPGDVFYLHSRLLERACKLNAQHGGGSLTALPVIETLAGDVSAYIPTNVISITDGQIYLESDLFYQGIRPALNVGLSVSRVGSAAQTKAMKKVAGKLRLELAQFRELFAFAQFGSDLDSETKARLERGRRIVEVLKQPPYEPLPVAEQVAVLFAVGSGMFDRIPVLQIQEATRDLRDVLRAEHAPLLDRMADSGELDTSTEAQLTRVVERFVGEFVPENDGRAA